MSYNIKDVKVNNDVNYLTIAAMSESMAGQCFRNGEYKAYMKEANYVQGILSLFTDYFEKNQNNSFDDMIAIKNDLDFDALVKEIDTHKMFYFKDLYCETIEYRQSIAYVAIDIVSKIKDVFSDVERVIAEIGNSEFQERLKSINAEKISKALNKPVSNKD